jgi:CRISPR-associated protein Cmr3
MSKPIVYQVDLRPMDVFFFGGEQHFGEGEDSNYFVHSNFYPQQSGVLGMLRHQLLIQNDCIPVKGNETKASGLIGEESYNINGEVTTYGSILNISPIFISKEQDLLFPEAFEYYFDKIKDKEKKKDKTNTKDTETLSQVEISFKGSGQTLIYPDVIFPKIVSVGDSYLGKYEIMELLVTKNGTRFNYLNNKEFVKKGTLPENGVFTEIGKPGIQKSSRKEKGAKDQGFYKQFSYTFPEKTCFTFFVEIDREIAKTFGSGRIMIGGEKSPFHMVVSDYKGKESPFQEDSGFYKGLYENRNSSLNKIVCISDCVVANELAGHITFMSNTMIDFRNSRTKVVNTSDYNRMEPKYENVRSKYDSPVRSNKYQLLKKGTVIWVTDTQLDTVKTIIKKNQHRAIGYNYIKIINHL